MGGNLVNAIVAFWHSLIVAVPDGNGIAALLHLGAMAVLVTIGYLGLDKLHIVGDAMIKTLTEKHKGSVKQWLNELELTVVVEDSGGKKVTNPALANNDAYVLLYVCEYDVARTFWGNCKCFFYRQRFVPGLNYFRKKHHLMWLSIWSLASSTYFSLTVSGEVFEWRFTHTLAFEIASLLIYVSSLAFVFGSTVTWYLLNAWMTSSCEWLEKQVADNIRFLKNSLGPPGANAA